MAAQNDYIQFLEKRLRSYILEYDENKPIAKHSSSRALKHFPIKPQVEFSLNESSYTAMEVIAQDQPGLLHNVARILKRHNLVLLSARITTFGERAEDIFYIRNGDHSAVNSEDTLQQLKQQICAALVTNDSAKQKKSSKKTKSS